jgi:hypothetical protein
MALFYPNPILNASEFFFPARCGRNPCPHHLQLKETMSPNANAGGSAHDSILMDRAPQPVPVKMPVGVIPQRGLLSMGPIDNPALRG